MADRVKDVASEEAIRIRNLTTEAARSGAYLYPLKGIAYFLSHRALWKPLMSKLVPALTLGLTITGSMFVFTYLPQAAILAFTSGPVAAVSAALLVLSESSTIFNIVSKSFLIEDSLVDTFDGTLLSRNDTSIVSKGREVRSAGDSVARLGKMIKSPFAKFAPKALIRYLLYLPLNFIPVVGTVIFVILNGKRSGPERHARYFQLKSMTSSQREEFVERRRGAYTSFGVTAALLEMVPIASIVFNFTNTCGAALWAADLEQKDNTSPKLRDQAAKAE